MLPTIAPRMPPIAGSMAYTVADRLPRRHRTTNRYVPETDETTRTQIIETVSAAFECYVHGAEVRFPAACWMVHARARPASH